MATRNPAFTHQLIWLNFPMSIKTQVSTIPRLVVKSRRDFWGCHQQYVCVTLAAASPPVLLRSKAVNFLILHWLITCPPLITSPEGFLPVSDLLLGIPQWWHKHTQKVSKTHHLVPSWIFSFGMVRRKNCVFTDIVYLSVSILL